MNFEFQRRVRFYIYLFINDFAAGTIYMHKFVKKKYSLPTTAGMLVRPTSTQNYTKGKGG